LLASFVEFTASSDGRLLDFSNVEVLYCEHTDNYKIVQGNKNDDDGGGPSSSKVSANNIRVLKYGSDPLKTYLPDSDIDITLVLNSNFRVLASDGSQQTLHMSNLDQLKLLRDYLERFQELSAEELDDDLDNLQENKEEKNSSSKEEKFEALPLDVL